MKFTAKFVEDEKSQKFGKIIARFANHIDARTFAEAMQPMYRVAVFESGNRVF